MTKKTTWVFAGLILSYCLSAYAAPTGSVTTNEQLENMRRQSEEQQSQIEAPHVQLQENKSIKQKITLPNEPNGFYIRKIQIDKGGYERFSWLEESLQIYTDRTIGIQGVNALAKHISEQLIAAGYVTTKVIVPEQELNIGILRFTIIPGKISDIRFEQQDTWGTWRNAFPCRAGDILNVRALEQGLEQMKRLPNQDVNMQLVPGKKQEKPK